ncbi:MAG: SRPBCC domain-containing protein [Anaerolineae bacterium]|nr:SRPBCC domain-containing protein [Anaerolineae bacterium]
MSIFGIEAVITKSITVQRGVDMAFRIWTERIDLWWPRNHALSGDLNTQVFLEGKVGGRFFERTSDGHEIEWGEVAEWQPPHHFAYHWYGGSSIEQPSRVVVRFTPLAENQTRVDIEHRGPEYIGELWGRTSPGFNAAWDHLLPCFSQACESE